MSADQFHNALTAAGLEYAGMSWGGFNLFGTRKDIDEARRLLHAAEMLPTVRDQLLEELRLSFFWMKKHNQLLAFIQARPAVLKELIETESASAKE